MDETLELFKGQMDYKTIANMSFKQICQLRNTRIKRYNEEAKNQEKARKEAEKKREHDAIRSKILKK